MIENILLFLSSVPLLILSAPIFEMASGAPVSYWTKFIVIARSNAPIAKEMRSES
jgi:hypothetical protein